MRPGGVRERRCLQDGAEAWVALARSSRAELLDAVGTQAGGRLLADNLRDIRRANRLFGGTRALLGALYPLLDDFWKDDGEPSRILDLATGSADIPLAIVAAAAQRDWHVQVTATDAQPEIVAAAREATRPGVLEIEQADARELPYPDASFDIVLLSLALHHFEPGEATRVLREMRRVSRRAMIVNDLERSRAGLAGAWLFAHALTRNPMTRHDAPLSVRRAYTLGEALALARSAGWVATRGRRAVPFRIVLTGAP